MITAIEERRSIRKYKDKPIPEDLLMDLLRAASLAPSSKNTQPWQFVIVDDPQLKEDIARVSHNQKWMVQAPVYILCVADLSARIPDSQGMEIDEHSSLYEVKMIVRDTAIIIDHLMLEACHRGLGTCWIAWYEQKDLRPILNIPKDKYVVGVVTLGYGDEAPAPRSRKKLDELIHRNGW